MTENKFPLVSDGEAMLSDMPQMNLYDELDLISNIKGDYQDRNYLEWEPIAQPHLQQVEGKQAPSLAKREQKSYSELAREEARADLKKKRSASYLTSDVPIKAHSHKLKAPLKLKGANKESQPTAFFQKEQAGEFAKFSKKLRQEDYILADLKPDYRPKEEEQAQAPKVKKNNYDFLRTSQIYNKKEIQSQRERSIAQELNLTRLSD
ncbi:cystathionine gamma-synthase [Streptococcus oricebi]|uniref:Cystathionine gamma-synthase n=1 Tax=Streptococcus oricebi TaxID=1547447 RepID=A0ABS5B3L6_9STRE|nr:cystathionine gamma-synthase [Streptococcus oricebi]MBP2623427.1 cystathionine gamma-synthase [Streptococcus oricebi]